MSFSTIAKHRCGRLSQRSQSGQQTKPGKPGDDPSRGGAQAPISPTEKREAQLAWRTIAKPRCAVSMVRNGTCMKCDARGVTIYVSAWNKGSDCGCLERRAAATGKVRPL